MASGDRCGGGGTFITGVIKEHSDETRLVGGFLEIRRQVRPGFVRTTAVQKLCWSMEVSRILQPTQRSVPDFKP
jgi:hypothetical protein